jgi:hypothetical protein
VRALEKVKLFLYGMLFFDLEMGVRKAMNSYNKSIMVALYADLLGVPILTNYYSFRLLPYLLRDLEEWKREISKEFDILEEVADIH